MQESIPEVGPFQYSLRSFFVVVVAIFLAIAILLPASIGNGGLFVAPYRLFGETILLKFVMLSVFGIPILAIGLTFQVIRNRPSPVSTIPFLVLFGFGVLNCFSWGSSSDFYSAVQFLAPALFVLSIVCMVEVAVRRMNEHILTASFVFGLAITYWHCMLTVAAVVG